MTTRFAPLLLVLMLPLFGCKEHRVPRGMLYGRDISGTLVTPEQYESLKRKLTPVAVTADAAPRIEHGTLSFSAYAENTSPEPVDVYYVLSAALPGQQALSINLFGEGIDGPRSDGPEVYDAIGRIAVTKLVVPAGKTVRFDRELPLARYEYAGSPTAKLYWAITLNETPANGTVTVSLPSR